MYSLLRFPSRRARASSFFVSAPGNGGGTKLRTRIRLRQLRVDVVMGRRKSICDPCSGTDRLRAGTLLSRASPGRNPDTGGQRPGHRPLARPRRRCDDAASTHDRRGCRDRRSRPVSLPLSAEARRPRHSHRRGVGTGRAPGREMSGRPSRPGHHAARPFQPDGGPGRRLPGGAGPCRASQTIVSGHERCAACLSEGRVGVHRPTALATPEMHDVRRETPPHSRASRPQALATY